MEELRAAHRKAAKGRGWRSSAARPTIATHDDVRRDIPTVIDSAAELTLRHLDTWQLLAGPNTRVSYVLQPMSLWMRDVPAPQEKLLFDEIDRISTLGTWEALYGDISTKEVSLAFSEKVRAGCEKRSIPYYNLNPVVADATSSDDWLFVDRAHYTDKGTDIVAGILADTLKLS
jgi:hypothetical protein